MKKILILIILFTCIYTQKTSAQEISPIPTVTDQNQMINTQITPPKQDYYKAIVEEVIEQGEKETFGYRNYYQTLRVKILEGKERGTFTIIQNGDQSQITKDQLVKKGQDIIITKLTYADGKTYYAIYDYFRLDTIVFFLFLFFLAVIIISGLRGIGSTLGMVFSLGVIMILIVPNILTGKDPLTITILGSLLIMTVSTYLAHGISKKTTIAVFSTFLALIITAIFSILAIDINHITGLGNEDLFALQIGPTNNINIKGLFLSGIIISTLGALNDITTTQASAILEFRKANDKLKFIDLFKMGSNVGKEHIASLVNTLILAYAGSAFAVFIFLALNPLKIPYWVIINNELISDEIIKVIAGSMGLLLSVPIVTAIAAYVFSNKNQK